MQQPYCKPPGRAPGVRPLGRWLLGLTALLAVAGAGPVAAHPLGNFSISHYAHFGAHPNKLALRYVLDLAEIPTVTQRSDMDTNVDGHITEQERAGYLQTQAPELAAHLVVSIDERPARLDLAARQMQFRPGAGGLDTLRIVLDLTVALPPDRSASGYRVHYTDLNFAERTGWREIVATAAPGATIINSTAATADLSHELTVYPTGPGVVQPQQSEASFTVATGTPGAAALGRAGSGTATTKAATAPRTPRDAFTQTIAHRELTPSVMLAGLFIAFLFGGLHALSPGHGKTMVAAYLVGSRGTLRHAALLGVVVTVTHTFGVFMLGLVTLFASRYIVPERLYPLLSAASGATICAVGLWLLLRRVRGLSDDDHHHGEHAHDDHHHEQDSHDHHHTNDYHAHDHHAHDHHAHDHHAHDHHTHSHGHHHVPEGPVTVRTLVALGVSGGIVPCPSALVVLLSAIALHRVAYGMLLISAFSFGLAAVLIGIGLMVVTARQQITSRMSSTPAADVLLRGLPVASAAAITLIGIALVVRALVPGAP